MKNLDLTFDFSSNKIKIKSKQNPKKPMIPNEILSKKIKLKVDLPSPARVVREKLAGAGCRGPSLSTKGPHTDACPLWDPPLSTEGFILSFEGQYIDACLVCPGLDPGSKIWKGAQKKT